MSISQTRLYRIWSNMKLRTTYEKNDNYKYYGGRGIKMCESWLQSFTAFSDWANSHGYTDELSIDRIDNNGDYSPDNCRFVTMKDQCKNKRALQTQSTNFGKTRYNIAARCHQLGINQKVLVDELNRSVTKTNHGDFCNYDNGKKQGAMADRLCI